MVLIIDALNECIEELLRLLNLLREISLSSSLSSYIKWIVLSRNWPVIKNKLKNAKQKINIYLKLNKDSISAAV